MRRGSDDVGVFSRSVKVVCQSQPCSAQPQLTDSQSLVAICIMEGQGILVPLSSTFAHTGIPESLHI